MLRASYCSKQRIVTIKMDIETYNDFYYEINEIEDADLHLSFDILDRCQIAISNLESQDNEPPPYLTEAYSDPLDEDEPDELNWDSSEIREILERPIQTIQ